LKSPYSIKMFHEQVDEACDALKRRIDMLTEKAGIDYRELDVLMEVHFQGHDGASMEGMLDQTISILGGIHGEDYAQEEART